MQLQDKVALVTGGSRGIGGAISQRLAQMGAKVVVNYYSREALAHQLVSDIRLANGEATVIKANIANPKEVRNLFAGAIDTYGKIDILVNNAGIRIDNLLLRMKEEEWDEVMNVNLRGSFLCSREAIRSMLRNRWGRIINISSAIALKGNIGQTNYTASKAALMGFTYALAREVATRNITVNSVLPGYVETDIVADLSDQLKEMILSHIPMARFGTPDEIAALVVFLCTDEARYITGQCICADGGISL